MADEGAETPPPPAEETVAEQPPAEHAGTEEAAPDQQEGESAATEGGEAAAGDETAAEEPAVEAEAAGESVPAADVDAMGGGLMPETEPKWEESELGVNEHGPNEISSSSLTRKQSKKRDDSVE